MTSPRLFSTGTVAVTAGQKRVTLSGATVAEINFTDGDDLQVLGNGSRLAIDVLLPDTNQFDLLHAFDGVTDAAAEYTIYRNPAGWGSQRKLSADLSAAVQAKVDQLPVTLEQLEAADDAADLAVSKAGEALASAGVATTQAGTATTAAATATTKSTEATTARDVTVAAKDETLLARDAALVGGALYPDIATGRAAVADNAYFRVLGSGEIAYRLYQRLSSSTETFVLAMSSSAALDHRDLNLLRNLDDGDDNFSSLWAWALVDGSDQVAIGIRNSGEFFAGAMGDQTVAVDVDLDLSVYVWALVDADGKAAIGVRRDGTVDLVLNGMPIDPLTNRVEVDLTETAIALLKARSLGLAEGKVGVKGDTFHRETVAVGRDRVLSTVGGLTRPYIQRTDVVSTTYLFDGAGKIAMLSASGQSLAVGAGGEPVIHAVAPAPQHALMFNTGARGVGGAVLDQNTLTDFMPLVEALVSGSGETQGSGMASWLYRKSRLVDDPQRPTIFRTHGSANRTIAELSKGGTTACFANGVKEVQRAVVIGGFYGKQIWVPSVFFTQGENDRGAGTALATYKAALLQLQNDYDTDFRAALPGDNGTVKLIVDQLCAASTGGVAGLPALAQLSAARDDTDIILSVPKYIFSMVDNVHLRAIEYARLGEYQAKVWRRLNLEGEAWKPLWPTAVNRTGASIVIDFYVPRGPLVLDTEWLPKAPNFGFEYADDTNSAVIQAVALTGAAQVTLTLSTIPTGANKKVRYAYTGINLGAGTRSGAWGNLRDSDDEPSFVVPGSKLYNPCVIFEEAVA